MNPDNSAEGLLGYIRGALSDGYAALAQLKIVKNAKERGANAIIGAVEYSAYLGILYVSHQLLREEVLPWVGLSYTPIGAALTGDSLSRIIFNTPMLNLDWYRGNLAIRQQNDS